jgi:hypothetical protein
MVVTIVLTAFVSIMYGLFMYVALVLAFPKYHEYIPITNYEIYGLCFAMAICSVITGFLIGRYTKKPK